MFRGKLIFGHVDDDDNTLLGFYTRESWPTIEAAKAALLDTIPTELGVQIVDAEGGTVFHA